MRDFGSGGDEQEQRMEAIVTIVTIEAIEGLRRPSRPLCLGGRGLLVGAWFFPLNRVIRGGLSLRAGIESEI